MNARTITTTTTASINFIAVSYRPYAIVLSLIASHGADCAMPTYSTISPHRVAVGSALIGI